MRTLGRILSLAATLPLLAAAGVITTVYDAGLGTVPDLQGFTAAMAPANNAHVTGGVLDVDGYGPGVNNSPGYYLRQNGTFLFSSFVMESRLRIVDSTQNSGPGGGSYPRGGFILEAVDNNGLTVDVQFANGGLWMQTSDGVAFNPTATGFLSLDTSIFHTYRFEADGTNASLFIDGAASPSLSLSIGSLQASGGATSTVLFGDASLLTRAHYQTQYFLFSSDLEASLAPEPGTLGMLGLAMAGLAARRYRKSR